jgi:hypothetical protein
VVLDDFSTDALVARIRQYAAEQSHGVHVLQFSKFLGISTVLAKEYVMVSSTKEFNTTTTNSPLTSSSLCVARFAQEAERKGVLCRDESPEGLLFFPNRFMEF